MGKRLLIKVTMGKSPNETGNCPFVPSLATPLVNMNFGCILFAFACLLANVDSMKLFDKFQESDDTTDTGEDERNVISVDRLSRALMTTLDGGYSKDSWTVYYMGKKVDGASANSFQSLGSGYGKDSWHVYYMGRKVDGASANSFQSLGGGYGKDSWNVYFQGRKVAGASANSFQSLGSGYGKDSWHVYLMGNKIDGASPNTFNIGK
ncbi:unnamed protein product [Rotaria socialis]|uniref:Uncharacterized protein n=2 Tax=Rotaria socialis TaxID=392032 RepID=A0A821H6C3_9BILA|nr:unnamed protein product [Rotaria socialis]